MLDKSTILGPHTFISITMSKTIILVHGYGFDQRTWDPLEIAFDGFKTIRFSLPGFGSDTPKDSYTIASLAKHYWEQIDSALHPKVHLTGHSMGGYVCIEMAAQQPSRVASLSLLHSHVFEDSVEKKAQRTATVADIKANGRSSIAHKMIPSFFADAPGFKPLVDALVARGMSYEDPAWYYGAQAMRDRADHAETLTNLQAPVLMMSGLKDVAVPSDLVYRQASLASKNTLILYEGVGHLGMYEKTAEMICDLIKFYNSVEAGQIG